MSDYMFMLDSHLTTEQGKVVSAVQAGAADACLSLFLTGGAMRDMLGGFPIRDLDFTVEGNALKLAKAVSRSTRARILSVDEARRAAELCFPGGVTASISTAHQERYTRAGSRPQITQSTIHEDLRSRDFTINAIALSLNRASRGLLLDPNNGLADLERKELRAVGNYTLYDDPTRLLRLVRFRVRLGFTLEERTRSQYDNARAAGMENYIGARVLFTEFRHIADEPNPAELLAAFQQEKLLGLFSQALAAGKLNLAGLTKLQKAKQLIPFGADFRLDNLSLLLNVATEKLTPKEKAVMAKALAMHKKEVDLWKTLESRSRALERSLKSAKLSRPSLVYQALVGAPGDQILFLLLRSPQRIVHDRIRNYLQKYLPSAQEITERELTAAGAQPGTPKYAKLREELIAARLDGRNRKPPAPPVAEAPAPPPQAARKA